MSSCEHQRMGHEEQKEGRKEREEQDRRSKRKSNNNVPGGCSTRPGAGPRPAAMSRGQTPSAGSETPQQSYKTADKKEKEGEEGRELE